MCWKTVKQTDTEKNLANNLYIIFFHKPFLLWSGLLICTHLFFQMNNLLLPLFGDSSLKLPADNTFGIISKTLLDKVIVNRLSHFSLSHSSLIHSTNSFSLRSSIVLNPSPVSFYGTHYSGFTQTSHM